MDVLRVIIDRVINPIISRIFDPTTGHYAGVTVGNRLMVDASISSSATGDYDQSINSSVAYLFSIGQSTAKLESISSSVAKLVSINATLGEIGDDIDVVEAQLLALNSFCPAIYDYVGLTYTGANLTGVLYKTGGAGGSTVSTLTLAYTGARLDSVTKT